VRLGGTALATGLVKRKLAAILAADVAGYSRLMQADEDGMHERFQAHRRELVDPKIRQHHGRIVKNTGDSMLVEFASPVEAVWCAVEMHRGTFDRDTEMAAKQGIRFRIGIDLGEIIVNGNHIVGDGVNVAAHLAALTQPGGICISSAVHDHIRGGSLSSFTDIGEQSVKNVTKPVRAYVIEPWVVAWGSRPVALRVTSEGIQMDDAVQEQLEASRRKSLRSAVIAASGVLPMWLALSALVIAAVALSPFWAPQVARLLPWGEKSPALAQDYTALTARLTDIEKRPDPLIFEVQAIKSAESMLARRVDQLEAALSRLQKPSAALLPPDTTAAPARPAPSPPLPTEEIAQLVGRGDTFLHAGDIASARLFYERAAGAGDGQAALRMGATFDPAFLDRAAPRAARGDPAEARVWYERARDLGEVEAERRLKSLGTKQGKQLP
jgi:class 3 adenylate cyclase